MPDLKTLLAELEEDLRSLTAVAELSQQRLTEAAEDAHALLLEINKLAEAAKNEDLAEFLLKMTAMLNRLHQIAQENAPADAKNLPAPQQILQQLNAAYKTNLQPLIENLHKDLANNTGDNSLKIQQLGMVATLGSEVFRCCSAVNNNWDKMNSNQKIASTIGMVMMFTGLGMLVAATINPVSVPVLAAITVITLGCFLCKKAVEKRNTLEANIIRDSTDKQLEHTDTLSKIFGVNNYPRQFLTFVQPQTNVKVKAEEQTPATPKPTINLLDRFKASLKSFFDPN